MRDWLVNGEGGGGGGSVTGAWKVRVHTATLVGQSARVTTKERKNELARRGGGRVGP